MKIIEKEITTKERIIQMTEKELSDIKNKCYYNGINDAITAIYKDTCSSKNSYIGNEIIKQNRERGFY